MIQRMATTDPVKNARAPSLPLSGMLLVKLGRALQRGFNDALRPIELTPRHLQVLDELRQGPMSQQALADRVGADPTKLVGLLNDLESQHLVLRRRDPVDRRRHIVENSRQGEARVDAALAAAAAIEDDLLAGLDGEQRAQLRELLVLAAESSGLSGPCADPALDAAAEQDDCGDSV
jgi:MarR family transcriptional regulator, lower aerobic nicotinate degradation pathway regulator